MARAWDEADQLRRWHQNVANGSEVYADVSERRLRAFCAGMKVSPTEIVESDLDDLRRILEDYLGLEKKRGHSGEYIRTTLKAVRSWRVYNGKQSVEGLKVPNSTLAPRVENEQMPNQEDLRRLLLAAKPNERVAICLMAFSGCRPQVIGNYLGTDGLRLSDLPELSLEGDHIAFEKVPTQVRVRAANSKAKHGFVTFLGDEGCRAIAQYLEARVRSGEKLSSDSDLVHPEKAGKRFVRALNIGDGIRRAMRSAGLDQRPYVWRSYFLSRLLEAANAGKVSDRYVEFWAGHRGDVTAKHYTTGRANLPPSMLEDMRAAYKRCEPFLSTIPIKDESGRTIKLLLMVAGLTQEEVDKLDVTAMPDEELLALAEKVKAERGAPAQKPGQKAVPIAEVDRMIEEGWEYLGPLGTEKAVMRCGMTRVPAPGAFPTLSPPA